MIIALALTRSAGQVLTAYQARTGHAQNCGRKCAIVRLQKISVNFRSIASQASTKARRAATTGVQYLLTFLYRTCKYRTPAALWDHVTTYAAAQNLTL